MNEPQTAPEAYPRPPLREFVTEWLRGLADFQFQSILTTRMLPTIYVIGVLFSALAAFYLIMAGFRASTLEGFAWLVVFGPASFLAMTTVWRILLELCFGFFQVVLRIEQIHTVALKISGQAEEISGQADQIAAVMPRITFWRSWLQEKVAKP